MNYTRDSEVVKQLWRLCCAGNCSPDAIAAALNEHDVESIPEIAISDDEASRLVAMAMSGEHPSPPQLPGIGRKGNALLVYAWGETEADEAAICRTRGQLRRAIADLIVGDDEPEIDRVMAELALHDFGNEYDDGDYQVVFEIGGFWVRDVFAGKDGGE